MGLFSFLKKAGAALVGGSKPVTADSPEPKDPGLSNEQKEMLLRGIITNNGLKIENLTLTVNDDHVIVGGEVTSQAEREKIILALGNVSGIATVEDNIVIVAPPAQFHEVKKGDTLSKIAKQYYGDPMKYPVIFEANKPLLKDPDRIYPGQVLRIPPLENA
ncbi:MAG: peptidoglycan-binding protein LysM [Bacteroidetes bacterium]|nr:MAG: peptidoglycan-binding protein LysM [Bacteroidota bacterium]